MLPSVEWLEPRLNLSTEFWGGENGTEDELFPGKTYLDIIASNI